MPKLREVIDELLAAEKMFGDQIPCVAFTLDHGPFELSIAVNEPDESTFAHIQFGPDEDAKEPVIYKDGEDSE